MPITIIPPQLIEADNTGRAWFIPSITKVGINTTAPGFALHVIGLTVIKQTVDTYESGLLVYNTDANSGYIAVAMQSQYVGSIQVGDAGGWLTLVLQPSGGNVGVGTPSPTYRLQVLSGNGDQFMLDNTGQQFTQVTFANNNTQKALIAWDQT